MVTTAAASRRPWLATASWKTCAVPEKVVEIVGGFADGVDLDHPLEAAEGRRVFELHPLR